MSNLSMSKFCDNIARVYIVWYSLKIRFQKKGALRRLFLKSNFPIISCGVISHGFIPYVYNIAQVDDGLVAIIKDYFCHLSSRIDFPDPSWIEFTVFAPFGANDIVLLQDMISCCLSPTSRRSRRRRRHSRPDQICLSFKGGHQYAG